MASDEQNRENVNNACTIIFRRYSGKKEFILMEKRHRNERNFDGVESFNRIHVLRTITKFCTSPHRTRFWCFKNLYICILHRERRGFGVKKSVVEVSKDLMSININFYDSTVLAVPLGFYLCVRKIQ